MIWVIIFSALIASGDELATSSFRIGFTAETSFPAMGDEKDYADLLNDAGLDFSLDRFAMAGNLEALGDISDRFRIRGSVGVTHVSGAYKENYDPWEYFLIGIFTGGIGFLFPPSDDVIDLSDESITIEAEGYYVFSRSNSVTFSAGGGPLLSFVKRKIDSPNTSTSAFGSGIGFIASIRADQENAMRPCGCLPIVFGAEAGYKYNCVELSGDETDGFKVDFSGPFIKFGSYIPF